MSDVGARISASFADTGDLEPTGGDWAVVAGVPCQHLELPYPWATTGRLLALPEPPAADVVVRVADWLDARSPQWTVMVRAEDEVAGFERWDLLPVLVRSDRAAKVPRQVDIGPASSPDEFLDVYGAELAPLVSEAHLASPRMHHLVARVDGQPVGCARVRLMADTACVSAVTVRPAWRGRGFGAALTAAAGKLAEAYSDLVWLHCTPRSRALYEKLGYRHAGDHAQLVPTSR